MRTILHYDQKTHIDLYSNTYRDHIQIQYKKASSIYRPPTVIPSPTRNNRFRFVSGKLRRFTDNTHVIQHVTFSVDTLQNTLTHTNKQQQIQVHTSVPYKSVLEARHTIPHAHATCLQDAKYLTIGQSQYDYSV